MHRAPIRLFDFWNGLRCIVLLCVATASLHSEAMVLDSDSDNIAVGRYAKYVEDLSGTKTFNDLARENGWKTPENQSLAFAVGESALWFRFDVDQMSAHRRVLSWTYPLIDYVDVFVKMPSGEVRHMETGRLRPFRTRYLQQRLINLKIPEFQGTGTIYIRVKTGAARICEVQVLQEKSLIEKDARETLIFGVYFGILVIMALYNLSLFITIRDRNYLLYFIFVGCFLMMQAGLSGFSFFYLMPNSPFLYQQSHLFFLATSFGMAVVFSVSFLNMRQFTPRILRLVMFLTAIFAGIFVAGFFRYSVIISFGMPVGLALIALLLVAAVICIRGGYRPARYYLIAWAGLFFFGIIWMVSRAGMLPTSFITENGIQIGSAFEVLLLSLALGDRINLMKEDKEAAQRLVLERQMILTQSYARFVPSNLLALLNKSEITQVALGDAVQREMTVLFSDIRSFTTLSETMTPEENFRFLNAILQRTGPVIREHRGFIDKYIGDAIMALFPENPEDAVDAAIAMKQNLRVYNARREVQGFQPLKIGIGINTGQLMLGTIGEPERMEGTVISDAVNLASRIEGLTKHYGATLLVTEQTLFRMSDHNKYHIRMVDRVKVKGKSEPVAVFEVIDGDADEIVTMKVKTQPDFEHGVHNFLTQEFAVASDFFRRVLTTDRLDTVARLYLQKSQHFAAHGVPPDWEGATVMESK